MPLVLRVLVGVYEKVSLDGWGIVCGNPMGVILFPVDICAVVWININIGQSVPRSSR